MAVRRTRIRHLLAILPVTLTILAIGNIPSVLSEGAHAFDHANKYNNGEDLPNFTSVPILTPTPESDTIISTPAIDVSGPVREMSHKELVTALYGSDDVDGDGVVNYQDNCAFSPNPTQADSNANNIGDACDPLTTVLADLSIRAAVIQHEFLINDPVDFQFVVTNIGPHTAKGVKFMDQLPAGMSLSKVSTTQGRCFGKSIVTCKLGAISVGKTATVTVRVVPAVSGRLTNRARVLIDPTISTVVDPNVFQNERGSTIDVIDPSTTYTIAGYLKDTDNIAMKDAKVSVSGSRNFLVLSDEAGRYTLEVPRGGYYSITVTKPNYNFSPDGYIYQSLDLDQTKDYIGSKK